jgi:hypothetical protein
MGLPFLLAEIQMFPGIDTTVIKRPVERGNLNRSFGISLS